MFRSNRLATAAALTFAAFATPSFAQEADLVDTAIAAGDFTTLVAAVEAAGLVDTLKGEGPFTIFAPTDAAFAALPEGTLDTLLLPENQDQLVSILTYHVAPGAIMASDIAGKETAIESINGAPITVNATDAPMANEANVTATDIAASNGVIHVIDAVLLPE